ncbi:MAG: NRDE family protein [Sphingomonadales bacterium]|nr:NRDE family protein [Sphingomonadales bacterium]
MCVVALAWDAHPRWRLVIAANRDEFHARPAEALHRWEDGTLAGRDAQAGGTWLGVREAGRCVLVTNYRAPGFPQPDRPSRGGLVTALLAGADPLMVPIDAYNPFNLFCADPQAAHILTNHPECACHALDRGIHGLSNGAFDAPWPKTVALCGALERWLAGETGDPAALFEALADATPLAAADPDGPEPRFSAVFIRDRDYGTRCSSVLALDRTGAGRIIERRFDREGRAAGTVALDFRWPAA